MRIRVNSIKFNSSHVDGPGIRTVVYLQGCNIRCKGCHNKSTWDIEGGTEVDIEDLASLLIKKVFNKKITISGGEPLLQKEQLAKLINLLESFDIALYTGYDKQYVPDEILSKIKYLKYGQFKKECRTTILPYVGSSNQVFMEVEHAKV